MKRRELLAFGLAFFAFSGKARAEDNSGPAGIWKWSIDRSKQQSEEYLVKLKYADGKLTGTATFPNKEELTIHDTSFENGWVLFTVTQKRSRGTVIITSYSGKLDGDTITGKIDRKHGHKNRTRDWEAKREKY